MDIFFYCISASHPPPPLPFSHLHHPPEGGALSLHRGSHFLQACHHKTQNLIIFNPITAYFFLTIFITYMDSNPAVMK